MTVTITVSPAGRYLVKCSACGVIQSSYSLAIAAQSKARHERIDH